MVKVKGVHYLAKTHSMPPTDACSFIRRPDDHFPRILLFLHAKLIHSDDGDVLDTEVGGRNLDQC